MSRRDILWLALLVAVAAALRLPGLATGLWRDEGSTYFDATAATLGATIREIRLAEINPPGYFLLMRAWLAGAGVSDLTMKLPSFVAGLALVPATFVLGRRLGSTASGFVAAVFAAFSTSAIELSSDARPYALAALLGALATLAAFHLLDPNARRTRAFVAYVVCATAFAYVQYTGVLLAAGLVLGAVVARLAAGLPVRAATFALANAVVAVLFVPWLAGVGRSGGVTAAWLEPIGRGQVLGRIVEQFGFILPVDFMHVPYVVVLLGALVIAFARRRIPPALAVGGIALVAALVVEAFALLREPRYVFAFSPLTNASIAVALVALARRTRVAVATAAASPIARFGPATFAALLVTTLVAGVPAQGRGFARAVLRPERSGMRALVGANAGGLIRGGLIVVAPDYLGPALGYYLRNDPRMSLFGVPHTLHPEHFRCCDAGWRRPAFIEEEERAVRVRAAAAAGTIAFVYDPTAVDRGRIPFSRALDLRARLARDFRVVADRRYEGSLEPVAVTFFALRGVHSRPRRSSTE